MSKYLVEVLGTLFLVLTIPLALTFAGDLAPLVIGSMLMIMVYAGGHVSGAHYNPAVTLAVWMRGKIGWTKMIRYWGAQCIGAILGALLATFLLEDAITPLTLTASTAQVILAEVLFTFVLAWVVLHVATDNETEGNSYYGLAIGFAIMVGAYAVGAISGGSFNPAVSLGGTLAGVFMIDTLWMHVLGQLIGAFAASQLYLAVKGKK